MQPNGEWPTVYLSVFGMLISSILKTSSGKYDLLCGRWFWNNHDGPVWSPPKYEFIQDSVYQSHIELQLVTKGTVFNRRLGDVA